MRHANHCTNPFVNGADSLSREVPDATEARSDAPETRERPPVEADAERAGNSGEAERVQTPCTLPIIPGGSFFETAHE